MSTEVFHAPIESPQPVCVASDNTRDTAPDLQDRRPALAILGTRGIPAQHGGFETFAERLALHLTQRGWDIAVYCQVPGRGKATEAKWRGVRLIQLPQRRTGPLGTIAFDLQSTLDAARHGSLVLTLGYNTAVFCAFYRLRRRANLINMDGLEWQRAKWNRIARAWLYLNERLGCWFGNRLIADHPEIARHLRSRVSAKKVVMIPYGADRVEAADPAALIPFAVRPRQYALVIARPEPENSILEIVSAFSSEKRGKKLVVLGCYESERNTYHARVLAAASDEVIFPGAIYDLQTVQALRFFASVYIHGHTVGGTNPALVEALGAGCAVLAHDNRFNRWVAGEGASYFANEAQCRDQLAELLDDEVRLRLMRCHSLARFGAEFTWGRILAAYESLLQSYVPA